MKTEVSLPKEVEGSWEGKATDIPYTSYPELPCTPQKPPQGSEYESPSPQHFMKASTQSDEDCVEKRI